MVNLSEYEEYWQGVARRIEGIHDVTFVTVDQDMSKKVSSLTPATLPTLFVVVPSARTYGRNVDAMGEINVAVVFLMDKYDPQRGGSYDCIKRLQPIIQAVKQTVMNDAGMGCPVLGRFDLESLSTLPESEFYGTMAGWSIGFTFVDNNI